MSYMCLENSTLASKCWISPDTLEHPSPEIFTYPYAQYSYYAYYIYII